MGPQAHFKNCYFLIKKYREQDGFYLVGDAYIIKWFKQGLDLHLIMITLRMGKSLDRGEVRCLETKIWTISHVLSKRTVLQTCI